MVLFNLFCRCVVSAAFFLGLFMLWVFSVAYDSFMSSSICLIYWVVLIEVKN